MVQDLDRGTQMIITCPDLPAYNTPGFWQWLEAWHKINNPNNTYAVSIDTLPDQLRRFAREIDAAIEREFGDG
jgi:hypothetical protein